MMNKVVSCCFVLFLFPLLLSAEEIPDVKMNQIQVIGTHNSYHKISKNIQQYKKFLPSFQLIEYEHAPLDKQLDSGIRNFEIDLHLHKKDGWLVLHVPQLDTESHCYYFRDCLSTLRQWSDEHPEHIPICIILDLTNQIIILDNQFRTPNLEDLQLLEKEVIKTIGEEKIITPDKIRSTSPSLEEAILTHGWLSLSEARGKFYFVLHALDKTKEIYIDGNTTLAGKYFFVNSRPGSSYASIMIIDTPSEPKIKEWVQKGYIVKIFGADPQLADIETCKEIDKMAFSSGAQIIATDYPECSPHPDTGYYLKFPENTTIRYNPIISPKNIETPLEPYIKGTK